ncbi:ArsR family transcriptional regulator [Candidatus Saccharibacteria bacterium CPR2]|nr:ArsR family transcriptional regulator [Candidatus Saccharibacteria bacterium CPR2]
MPLKLNQTSKFIVQAFNALGDETRFKILQVLSSSNEICVSQIAKSLGITTAGTSQHLKILEQAGLIERQRMGQRTCYIIKPSRKIHQEIINVTLKVKDSNE